MGQSDTHSRCAEYRCKAASEATPGHLNELYAKLLWSEETEGGLAPRTVGHVHRDLHMALGHAAQWGAVASNVASTVSPPRVASVELEILTSKQTKELLALLQGRPLYMPVATALATGMRRSEIQALRWKDVDLSRNDRGQLRVEQSLEQTRRGLRLKAPKTKHGRRMMTARRGGQTVSPRNGGARSGLGLTVSLHAFRHTHASALIASGMDILTISRRLGHSSPAVTFQVYGHLFSNTDDRAAQIVQAAFSSRTA